jgi:hypothetical protein
MKKNKRKKTVPEVNFLNKRLPYTRKGTAQAVLGQVNPKIEIYSLCGDGCKSCTCSCTGGDD